MQAGDVVEAVFVEGSVVQLEVVDLDADRLVVLDHFPAGGERPSLPAYLTAAEARSLAEQLVAAARAAEVR